MKTYYLCKVTNRLYFSNFIFHPCVICSQRTSDTKCGMRVNPVTLDFINPSLIEKGNNSTWLDLSLLTSEELLRVKGLII